MKIKKLQKKQQRLGLKHQNKERRLILKINKLKINSYGKLKEKEINLKNGINIIYGQNGSGNNCYGKKGEDL